MGNYLYFIPAFTLALPFLYSWLIPEYATQKGTGLIVLIVSSVYSEFLAYEQIFLKDAEYPRALSLLCAAPYRRRDIIVSRYLLFCLVFAATAFVYTIPALFLPPLLPPVFHGIRGRLFPECTAVQPSHTPPASVRLREFQVCAGVGDYALLLPPSSPAENRSAGAALAEPSSCPACFPAPAGCMCIPAVCLRRDNYTDISKKRIDVKGVYDAISS